ncbi:hypothetical protein C7B79_35715 [Chroococcidiopsis cubana CCALA 043]|nr:hypothetical protein C7B79_35715 [Chroococcidiopsis cubana CCALA 043]
MPHYFVLQCRYPPQISLSNYGVYFMQSDPNCGQNSQQNSHTNSNSITSEVEQPPVTGTNKKRRSLRRRSFLGHAGIFTAAGVVAGVVGSPFSYKRENAAYARSIGPLTDEEFRENAYQVRVKAAQANRELPILPHPTNGDEERYDNKIATDTRGLPHDNLGEVDLNAYNFFIKALRSGSFDDFEKITLGGTRKLVNPIGPLAISLQGLTPPQFAVPPAPTLTSDEQAAEIIELYWQALLRDVPFSEFQDNTSNPLVLAAVEDLNKLSAYRGPKPNSRVTPQNLFRGSVNYVSGKTAAYYTLPGVTVGHFISQFLLLPAPLGRANASNKSIMKY